VEDVRSAIGRHQGPTSVILVNMPSGVGHGGIGAPTLSNRPEMASVLFGDSGVRVAVRHVKGQTPGGDSWSPAVTALELQTLASDGQTIVLVYDPARRRLRRMSAGAASPEVR
jgi:hypothetical protein